jgi:hypothetical protein
LNLRNSITNAIISTHITTASGSDCFTGLFDETYILEAVTPANTARTVPNTGSTYTVTVTQAATETRSFGYNGNAQICPNPTFRDVNEDGIFNGTDSAITGIVSRLYDAADLNTVLETITTNGVVCFAPIKEGNYVVEQDIPANSSATSGGTIIGNKVQKSLTHTFATLSNLSFGYKLVATNLAKAQPNPNQTRPVFTSTVVNGGQPVYRNYNFYADTYGLVDSGTNLPLTGIACSMTFSGPSFPSPVSKNGTVTNGTCHVDPVPPITSNGNQVVTQVQGDIVTLTTPATPFDVLSGQVIICTPAFADYNQNGTKESTEPLRAGVVTELRDGATVLQTTTSTISSQSCFTPVEPGISYTLRQTKPVGSIITTSGYIDNGTNLETSFTPDPGVNITKNFGYKGTGQICPNNTFVDTNNNGSFDSGEPLLTGYNTSLYNASGTLISQFANNNTSCFTDLLDANYSLIQTIGSLQVTNTTGGQTIGVNLLAGQNKTVPFGYRNDATICALPFRDYNRDNIRQVNEPYISGFQTKLIRQSDSNVMQTLSSTGNTTCFNPVNPDTYRIEQTPVSGYEHLLIGNPQNPYLQTITSQLGVANSTDVYWSGTGQVCFTAYQDLNTNGTRDGGELIVSGTNAALKDDVGNTISIATLTSEPNICFAVFAPPGQYRIDVTNPTNTIPTTSGGNSQNVNLLAGQSVNREFGYNGNPTICPVVFRDDNSNEIRDGIEQTLVGVFVELRDSANTTTISSFTSNGTSQCFNNLATGSYLVRSSNLLNFISTTNQSQSFNLAFAQAGAPLFGYNGNGSICANPTFKDDNQNGSLDLGETYYANLNTYLRQSSTGTPLQTVQTNSLGVACFTPVQPGTYSITQDQPLGGVSTTGGTQTIQLQPGSSSNVSFGYTGSGTVCPNPTFDDANFDTIKQNSEGFLAGVQTRLFKQSDLVTPIQTLTTDATGTLCFRNLFNDDYVVEQTPPAGYSITTLPSASQAVTINTGDLKTISFGYTNNTQFVLGAIRGFLYIDRNENGQYNTTGSDTLEDTVFDNDLPVTQQVVRLLKLNTNTSLFEEITTQVSGTDGTYNFLNLTPGTYKVNVPSVLGLAPVQPNSAEVGPFVVTSNEKFNNNTLSFNYTAKICPQLYIDKNNNSTFDGTDQDVLATDGRYFQLSYQSFTGTQIASNDNPSGYFIKTTGITPTPCIEHVPPRDYTLVVRAPGTGGSSNTLDYSFFSSLTQNQIFTIYLGTTANTTNRYYTTSLINRTPSIIQGYVWNNKFPNTGLDRNIFDANGADNQTGISGGYDRNFDNDTGYGGINVRLEKCQNGFEDPIPTTVWNANPPRTTTAPDGTYQFSGVIPGVYAVIRETTLQDEALVRIDRANQCQLTLTDNNVSNYIIINNYYNNLYQNLPFFNPGSTINLDHIAVYEGVGIGQLYTDFNHDNQRNNWENNCLNLNCISRLFGLSQLKDATTGNILLEVNDTVGNDTYFRSLPPGNYKMAFVSNNSAYPALSPTELEKTFTISTNEINYQTFGFNPTNESTILGKVFIDRNGGGVFAVNGTDANAATTFDNDVALSGYIVDLYFGQSYNQLAGSFTTDANGDYQFTGLAEGAYSWRVRNAAPVGTGCTNCSTVEYIHRNTTNPFALTYDFNGKVLLQSFFDTLSNGIRETNSEIDSSQVRFQITYSDGYIIGSNISPAAYDYPSPQFMTLPPGDYTVSITTTPTALSSVGGFSTIATYTLLASDYLKKDYPFLPAINTVSGQVFVDRGNLNQIFESNGRDGNLSLTFDNEIPVDGAIVTINGPLGAVQTTSDVAGNYTFSNLPSGRYLLSKQNPPPGSSQIWDVTVNGSLAGSLLDQCATAVGCRGDRNLRVYIDLSTGTVITNNYTFLYSNVIDTKYVDDKNGDGQISSYSNTGYTETILAGTEFELLTYTNEVLPCNVSMTVLGYINTLEHCSWDSLPPGNYTVRKLFNLSQKININTSKSSDFNAVSNVFNLGNMSNVPITIFNGSIQQVSYVNYFQFTPPSTNNASVIGRVYVDRNQNFIYQTSGNDGQITTPEDNDHALENVNLKLTGTSNLGQSIIRTTTTGNDGRYQITDLPSGSYQIQAGTP